jgi:hypothetical protein
MRVSSSVHGSARDVERMVQAHRAEGCDALVATGVVPAGVQL